MSKYMIATTANHDFAGDISRPMEDYKTIENLCVVKEEDEENYIGMWVLGMGFFGVKFPKKTTRDLTQQEIDYYNTKSVQINSQPPMPLRVD